MDVKYVVIDLSKIDIKELGEMLNKAYADGYQKGRESISGINAPTIPYSDGWGITNYSNTIKINGAELKSCSVGDSIDVDNYSLFDKANSN